MIFGGVGAGGPDWGWGSGGRRGHGREPDGKGVWAWSARWQEREGMAGAGEPDGSCLGVVGQEDQMAGVDQQEVDGREPDGVGQWGKKGQMAGRKGMAGCMRARWQLLG